MVKASIKAISYYLPAQILANDDLSAEFPEWSVDKISSKTGIYNRHIADRNESTSDMAVRAAEKLFNEYKIAPSEIDFILLCTQSPDYILPTTACIIQDKLNISDSAGALDFNLGCSGYVYGLGLAKGLITAGIAKNVLLITSEIYSKHIYQKDKSNRSIFGDAASASLISSAEGGLLIGDFELGTDGRGAENLIIKRGGGRYPNRIITDDLECYAADDDIAENHLYMNGPEIFNFTLNAVPKLVVNTLLKNAKSLNDIDLFVFHQANKYMLNHLRKKIGIDEAKFFYLLEDCGNTVSSTIPIALKEAFNQEKIQPEMNILLAGFGVGYSWGGVVLKSY